MAALLGIPLDVAAHLEGPFISALPAPSFTSGSVQVTWRQHGRVLARWTFTVELD